jgi:hypothetical protein
MPVRAPVTASVRAPVPAGVAAIALALLAAFAAPAGAAGAADPAPPKLDRLAIVDRAIEHHGGDRYAASETALDICSLSGCFHLVVRVDGGLYDYDVRGEVRGVERRVRATNDRAERWDDGEPAALDPEGERRARDFVDQENLGVDGDGLAVDQVTPEFVAARMRKVSDVVLRGIAVRSLGGEADGP